MHMSHGQDSSAHPHIEALRARHALLEQRIEDARKSPSVNDLLLRRMKQEKLFIKDEIYRTGTG